MALHRPASNHRPGDQSAQTPSGKDVPMAMSMMVDSMVRMIQKANNHNEELEQKEPNKAIDEN